MARLARAWISIGYCLFQLGHGSLVVWLWLIYGLALAHLRFGLDMTLGGSWLILGYASIMTWLCLGNVSVMAQFYQFLNVYSGPPTIIYRL